MSSNPPPPVVSHSSDSVGSPNRVLVRLSSSLRSACSLAALLVLLVTTPPPLPLALDPPSPAADVPLLPTSFRSFFPRIGELFPRNPPSLPKRPLLHSSMSAPSVSPTSHPPCLIFMLTPTFFRVRPCYLYPCRRSSLPAASLHHLTSKPHPPAVSPTRSPTCASARLSAHPSSRALAVCAPVRTTHAPSHIPQFPSHAYFMRLPLLPRLVPSLRVRRSQVRPFLSTIFASPAPSLNVHAESLPCSPVVPLSAPPLLPPHRLSPSPHLHTASIRRVRNPPSDVCLRSSTWLHTTLILSLIHI